MPPFVNGILEMSLVLYLALVLIESVLRRSVGEFLRKLLGVILAFLLLHWAIGFPSPRESFASVPSAAAIGIMYVCVILGMVANYYYYLEAEWSWTSFLKPVCISPMVLLPLLGTMTDQSSFEPVKLACLGLLAFQNGFFWRAVFKNAKPRVK